MRKLLKVKYVVSLFLGIALSMGFAVAQGSIWKSINTPVYKYTNKHYTVQEGLPSNIILSICLDYKGYLWVGTNAGLCRYDGHEFELFNKNNKLYGTSIWSIVCGLDDDIWVGTYDEGLYHYSNKEFQSIDQDRLSANPIRKLYVSKLRQLLLVGCEDGLFVYDISKGKPKIVYESPEELINGVNDFFETDSQILIASAQDGLFYFDPLEKKLIKSRKHKSQPENSYAVSGLGENKIAYGNSKHGLVIEDTTREYPAKYFDKIGHVLSIRNGKDGKLWIGAMSYDEGESGGIFRYQNGEISRVNELYGIEDNIIRDVFPDNETGDLWIATYNEGLYHIPSTNIKRQEFINDETREPVDIKEVFTDSRKNIWITGTSTIIKIDTQGLVKQLNLDNIPISQCLTRGSEDITSEPHYAKKDALKESISFYDLTEGPHQRIWISCSKGIIVIDSTLSRFSRIPLSGNLASIGFGPQGKLYYGSWYDAQVFNINDSWPVSISEVQETAQNPILLNQRIRDIFVTKSKLWMNSFHDGVYLVTSDTCRLFSSADNELFLRVAIIEDGPDSAVFLSGRYNNIYLLQPDGPGKFKSHELQLDKKISSKQIRWMKWDKPKYLWVGNSSDIYCLQLNPDKLDEVVSMRHIDVEEGIESFSMNSATILNNELLVGCPGKVYCIDLNEFYREYNDKAIGIKLTLELINQDTVLFSQHVKTVENELIFPHIVLDQPAERLWLKLNMVNLLNPGKEFLQVFIDSYDQDWRNIKLNDEMDISFLKPGDYSIHIRLVNQGIRGQNRILIFPLSIREPWYLRPVAIVLFILVFILMTTLVFRDILRRAKLREKARLEEKALINRLKIVALGSQLTPHFVLNTLNAIQGAILSKENKKAIAYLKDFSLLLRESMEFANQKYITLQESLNILESYIRLQQLRYPETFSYIIKIDKNIDPNEMLIAPFLLQPFAENAIKHGFKHTINNNNIYIFIKLECNKNCLFIQIEDNGIGRRKTGQKTQGPNTGQDRKSSTEIIRERIDLMNDTGKTSYRVETEDLFNGDTPTGTRVSLYLPVITK